MAQCVVSGLIANLAGQPVASAQVSFRIDRPANDVAFDGDGSAVADVELIEYTDEYGRFEIALTQGLQVRIYVPELGVHKQVTVPATATASLEELLNGNV